jgi:hypothetical protein
VCERERIGLCASGGEEDPRLRTEVRGLTTFIHNPSSLLFSFLIELSWWRKKVESKASEEKSYHFRRAKSSEIAHITISKG